MLGADWGLRASQPPHFATKLITAPATEPFTLQQAKLHCKIDIDDENPNLSRWITAARQKVERDTQRALMPQTWDLFLDAFYQWPYLPYAANIGYPRWPFAQTIKLPYPPLQSVTAVYSTDSSGVETTWSATNYVVDTASEPGRLGLSDSGSWPTGTRSFQPGRIRYVAGYADADSIPKDLSMAVALLIGWFSENRDLSPLLRGETESTAYDRLIANYVIWGAA